MNVLKTVVALLFLLGVASCSSNKNMNIQELELEFLERITEFPDSSFFSDIRMMEYHNGQVYILDVKRGDLVALTEDFKEMKLVAPHSEIDLVMPISFAVNNDTAYVCDYGSVKTMKVYINGCQVRSMSSFRFNEKRMALSDSFIWVSAPTDTSCYLKFNRWNPNEYILAGEVNKEKTEKRTIIKNDRHFFMENDDMLYAVPESYSHIEKYNAKTGHLEECLDISDIPFVKRNIQYAEHHMTNVNSYFVYVIDACLYKKNLFLLCNSLGDTYRCNMLLKIDIADEEMRVAGYHELPGNIYRTICVSDNYLFATYEGRDCAIEKYKLGDD